ncbi:hypothetical protein EJ08DRAFT_654711 [Tothia fuscella]|uniref:Uncharacterized protein n=1 Tax=Tothia fuscella TaxID=1048955 RepID=A0A9P4NEA7_9PEZI|nr:hypothetical protein EJ08DRAFT_654711 [Tothia fuscella]
MAICLVAFMLISLLVATLFKITNNLHPITRVLVQYIAVLLFIWKPRVESRFKPWDRHSVNR